MSSDFRMSLSQKEVFVLIMSRCVHVRLRDALRPSISASQLLKIAVLIKFHQYAKAEALWIIKLKLNHWRKRIGKCEVLGLHFHLS